MSQDGVSTAFSIIQEELDNVIGKLQQEGIQAFRNFDYSQITRLSEIGKDLDRFKEKVLQLHTEWKTRFDQRIREMTEVEVVKFEDNDLFPENEQDIANNQTKSNSPRFDSNPINIRSTTNPNNRTPTNREIHRRSRKSILRVALPNGRIIAHDTAAETFSEVLRIIGIEKVRGLNLRVSNCDLVSKAKHDKYGQFRVGEYWVMTNTSTQVKKNLLEQLGKELEFGIQVEIIPG